MIPCGTTCTPNKEIHSVDRPTAEEEGLESRDDRADMP